MVNFNPQNFRLWSVMGVNPCIWSIVFPEIIAADGKALALTADSSRFSGMSRTQSRYPERFFNFGIAEQNMVGAGAGLAMSGFHVFMTTYAPFMTYRAADQMRHLVGNLNLNIKSIGTAAGLSGGISGKALWALGDIALMRSIANMQVFSPADCTEAMKIMLAISKTNKPAYVRFCGATNIPPVYKSDYEFEIGKAVVLRNGKKIMIAASGFNIVPNALKAAEIIESQTGASVAVVNFHTIKPIDSEYLRCATDFDLIVSVEEHFTSGGLGGAIAETLADMPNTPPHLMLGVPQTPLQAGNRDFMIAQSGLDPESIANKVINKYKEILNDK